MKKEIVSEDYCPYCKRHCSLKDPHCKKGKELAEQRREDQKQREIENPEAVKKQTTELDIKLLYLFQHSYSLLSCKKIHKLDKLYILTILAEKDNWTEKELEAYSELSSEEFKELLLKLEKKGFLVWRKEMGDRKVFLTEAGLEAAKSQLKERSQDYSNPFSALNEEEKGYLEDILKKLNLEWKH